MNERITHIVDNSAQKVFLCYEVMVGILDVTRNEKNIILEKGAIDKSIYENEIIQKTSYVNQKIVEIDARIFSNEGQGIITDLRKNWDQYTIELRKVIQLTKNNKDREAFDLSIGRARDLQINVQKLMYGIIEYNRNFIQNEKVESNENYKSSLNLIILLIATSLVISGLISYSIISAITKRISTISAGAKKIASREFNGLTFDETLKDELSPVVISLNSVVNSFHEVANSAYEVAKGDYSVKILTKSKEDIIGNALNEMTESLKKTTSDNQRYNWLTSGQNSLNKRLAGNRSVEEISTGAITFLSRYVGGNIGALYLHEDNSSEFKLWGKYAFDNSDGSDQKFKIGEGIIGQAAADQKSISLSGIKHSELRLSSSVFMASPEHVFVSPFMLDQKVLGVVELGKREVFSETEIEFINGSMESIAISVNSAIARKRIQDLLEESQLQTEELQVQQEELRQMNEELEEQTQNLRLQQAELQAVNRELEHQAKNIEIKNKELEVAKIEVEKKTKDLEMSSKYKSEFLANMSHELRTPLNSILILSKDLANNKRGNLEEIQISSAQIIYNSGKDLLQLINEVIDLSKIEAGKMELHIERIDLRELASNINRNFKHIADEKGLKLLVDLEKNIPEFIHTDKQRIEQILRNLISNAIKFTHHGSVSVNFRRHSVNCIAIDVVDTGIGISEEKHAHIFEAFQQADGSTARKYGGTGLGLSISKGLARLIGAHISLESKVNEGATFTFVVPLQPIDLPMESFNSQQDEQITQIASAKKIIHDDRNNIDQKDKRVVIIDDDEKFVEVLIDQAHKRDFKGLVATNEEDGLRLALKYMPHAIILNTALSDMDGKTILAELKSNPSLRHIPVHVVSNTEKVLDSLKGGAVTYLRKPLDNRQLEEAFMSMESFINKKIKNLLIIEDDKNSRNSIKLLIGDGDVKCFEAETGKQALETIKEGNIDCVVLDLGLPDMTGFELIEELKKMESAKIAPIIVYTARDLTKSENDKLQSLAESVIIKGIKSEERLLDETALFLHRTVSDLPDSKRQIISGIYNKEDFFFNKKVLLVDDDMRNVFALSKVLKEEGMEIFKAENGVKALEALILHPETDLVLMDIMMPEMDGYEAIRRIRMQDKFKNLPIIALTAKAMKDDRSKCISAGANDYISKPIELERLLSLMRIWIKR